MQPNRNELHIIEFPSGHALSTDCWCEPSRIYWTKGPDGESVLMVEHHDDHKAHHKVIVEERNRRLDWITIYLNSIRFFPPPTWFRPKDE